jgi:hypothetical protein
MTSPQAPEDCVLAIACNHSGSSYIRRGAKAYVLDPNWGYATNRVKLLVRSRSRRWVRKWENLKRLSNFRPVNVAKAFRLVDLLPVLTADDVGVFMDRMGMSSDGVKTK